MSEQKVLHIGVIIFPRALPLDFIGPTSILLALVPEFLQTHKVSSPYSAKVTYVGAATSPTPLSGDLRLSAHTTFEECKTKEETKDGFDVILLPGGLGARPGEHNLSVQDFLKWSVPKAKWVLTVCTGSWLLAHTGLLSGQKATTNKMAFKQCVEANKDKNVTWIPKARYVVSDKFWSSSGVSAGMDMICGWIDEVCGAEVGQLARRYAEYNAAGKDDDPWAEKYDL